MRIYQSGIASFLKTSRAFKQVGRGAMTSSMVETRLAPKERCGIASALLGQVYRHRDAGLIETAARLLTRWLNRGMSTPVISQECTYIRNILRRSREKI